MSYQHASQYGLDSAPDLGWWDQAACQGVDVSVFYPNGGRGSTETARRICAQCPVRVECLEYAMAVEAGFSPDRRHGIWGGVDGEQRWELRRCRTGVCQHPEHQEGGTT